MGQSHHLGGTWWDVALEHSAFHVPRSANYEEGASPSQPPPPSPLPQHPQLSLLLLLLVAERGVALEGKCTAGDGKCCAGTDRAARSPRPAVMHIRCFISPRCCTGRTGPGVPLRVGRWGEEGTQPGMSPAAAAAFPTAVRMHLRKSTHTSPSRGLLGGTWRRAAGPWLRCSTGAPSPSSLPAAPNTLSSARLGPPSCPRLELCSLGLSYAGFAYCSVGFDCWTSF